MNGWEVAQRRMRVVLCGMIWKCRNELVWKQKGMEVSEVVVLDRVVPSEWHDAQDKNLDMSWGLLQPGDGDEHSILPKVNKI